MRLDVRKYVKNNGDISYYPRVVKYVAGKRKRIYVRAADAEALLGYWLFQAKIREFTTRKPGNRIGRPASLPPALKDLLTQSGYSVYGGRICKNKKNYLLKESTIITRFGLLNDEERKWIGTPSNLFLACQKARRRLASANRRSKHLSWDECLRQAITELHE